MMNFFKMHTLRKIIKLAVIALAASAPATKAQMLPQGEYIEVDLGGVAAKIPGNFAHLVTLSKMDDQINPSLRKIRGFGFYIRFPDMLASHAPNSTIACSDSQKNKCTNEFWVYVSVTSGEDYPGTGYLDRRFNSAVLNPPANAPSFDKYIRADQEYEELIKFSPRPEMKKAEDLRKFERFASEIFVKKSPGNLVLSYIRCSKRRVETATCRHDFSLEPRSFTGLSMSYQRKHLQEWKNIEQLVRNTLERMLTKPTTSN